MLSEVPPEPRSAHSSADASATPEELESRTLPLDPRFLRTQALAEDLLRLTAFHAQLRRLDRQILRHAETGTPRKKLGNAQATLLQALAQSLDQEKGLEQDQKPSLTQERGRLSQSELQHLLSISPQSLHVSLKPLIQAGYIARHGNDPRDRRRRLVALTDKGRALERELRDQQTALLKRAYRATQAHHIEGFRKTLAHLSDPQNQNLPPSNSSKAE